MPRMQSGCGKLHSHDELVRHTTVTEHASSYASKRTAQAISQQPRRNTTTWSLLGTCTLIQKQTWDPSTQQPPAMDVQHSRAASPEACDRAHAPGYASSISSLGWTASSRSASSEHRLGLTASTHSASLCQLELQVGVNGQHAQCQLITSLGLTASKRSASSQH